VIGEYNDLKRKIIKELEKKPDNRLTRAKLWEILGVDNPRAEAYWEAEQALVDDGRVERRRGRTGGIYLLPEIEEAEVPQQGDEGIAIDDGPVGHPAAEREENHYEALLAEILEHWTEQPGFKAVFGAVTGRQGRRSTGGRWSRPDLILCTVSEWLFSSRPEGDVRTIEVKRFDALDVLSVYEAVSHKSRSHYAYLLVVGFPEQLSQDQEKDWDNILSVAATNGIGIIVAKNSQDWATWEFPVDPTRSNADHVEINQLVLDQVPKEVRDKFTEAIRNINISVSF